MSQKYIRLKKLHNISDVILVFPEIIDHSAFTRQLGFRADDVVSAGFTCIDESDMGNPVYRCYGRSVSLNKESIPVEDSKYLNYQLYNTYDKEDY